MLAFGRSGNSENNIFQITNTSAINAHKGKSLSKVQARPMDFNVLA